MFLYNSQESINTVADLPLGVYLGRASTYEFGLAGKLIQAEFCLEGRNSVSFVEIMVQHKVAVGYSYRDFLLMPDGYWRDSAGEKAQNVASLFPPELLSARLIDQQDIPPVFHGSKS